LEVVTQDDISDAFEHPFDIVRIGGARDERIKFSHGVGLKMLLELVLNIGDGFVVVATAVVFREADFEVGSGDLLAEQIVLVEEEDDGRVAEPYAVAYLVE